MRLCVKVMTVAAATSLAAGTNQRPSRGDKYALVAHGPALSARATNQFGERSERLPDLCFSISRFSQVVFIPQAQPHAQSLFQFPIVYYN